jgi:transcriptional regulator with XRE-family HTH domain
MTSYNPPTPIRLGIWDATVDAPGAPIDQKMSLWDTWLTFPTRRARLAPRVQYQVREMMSWTGWSARTLAELLGTTHPTISAIAAGRSSSFARVPDLPARLAELHGLLERLNMIAADDVVELNRLLGTAPDEREASALDHILGGDLTGAWLAAADVVSPRRTTGMMRGRFPTRPGQATAALHE